MYTMQMAPEVLQRHPAEAEALLRLGAVANALLTIGRAMPAPPFDPPTVRQDALQLTMIGASYIYVAVDQLDKRRDGLWWRLAAVGSAERELPMDLQELQTLLAHDSPFARTCARIRDKYAFHVDPDPFSDFVTKVSGPVTVFMVTGDAVEDVMFPASYNALIAVVPELMSLEFSATVSRVIHTFPFMVEAIAIAFGRSKGDLTVIDRA